MKSAVVAAAVATVVAATSGTAATLVVTSKNIKNGTIQTVDLSAKAKRALKGNRGPAGQIGPQGPPGQAGAAGAAIAYASVHPNGTVAVPPLSKNITSANITHSTPGLYCFTGLSFQPYNVIASMEFGGSADSVFATWGTGGLCPTGTQMTVLTTNGSTPADGHFMLLVN